MKLHALKFGMALGIAYAIVLFVIALVAGYTSWNPYYLQSAMDVFPGYKPGFVGGIFGAVGGYVFGQVVFGIAGWIYNLLIGGSS